MATPNVQERRQKNLVLILAREFASKLATPAFVADAAGTLVFFNEAAEKLLGKSFAEVGEISVDEWAQVFQPEEDDGTPMPPERRPSHITVKERRPAHRDLCITTLDGVRRKISTTGVPLFTRSDEVVGMMSFFWERPEE
jgi:PAS domain-containing protein